MVYFNGWGSGWKNADGRFNLSVTTADLRTASVRVFEVSHSADSVRTYTDIHVSGSLETLEQWVTTLQTALAEIRQKELSAE